jgi:hypothetical protein
LIVPTFALITEGITDQVVLESVIRANCRSMTTDEIDVVPLQPTRDATDTARAKDFGGWEKIFEFCSSSARILEALDFNDYVVIHIDTDCAEPQVSPHFT